MAERYWIATTTGNWNNTSNWSTTNGGAGGATVPGNDDDAIFNAGELGDKNGNCNVDVALIGLRLTNSIVLAAPYSGTLNLSTFNVTTGMFVVNSGTVTSSTGSPINISGLIVGSSGTYSVNRYVNASAGIMMLGNISLGNNTFNINGGLSMLPQSASFGNSTFILNALGSNIISNDSVDFYNIIINGTYSLDSDIVITNNLIVDGSLTVTINNTVDVQGDLQLGGTISGPGKVDISGGGGISLLDGDFSPRYLEVYGTHQHGTDSALVPGTYAAENTLIYWTGNSDVILFSPYSFGDYVFEGDFRIENTLSDLTAQSAVHQYNYPPNFIFYKDVIFAEGSGKTLPWERGNGTITLANGAGSHTINFLDKPVEQLVINGATKTFANDVNAVSLEIISGYVNFNEKTFTFDTTNDELLYTYPISDDNDFIIRNASSLTLEGATFNVNNDFRVFGESGEHFTNLYDLTATETWFLNVNEESNVQFARVSNSDASGGNTINGIDCIDFNDNENWDISGPYVITPITPIEVESFNPAPGIELSVSVESTQLLDISFYGKSFTDDEYVLIGTIPTLELNSIVRIKWFNLNHSKRYLWYASLEGSSVQSDIVEFVTDDLTGDGFLCQKANGQRSYTTWRLVGANCRTLACQNANSAYLPAITVCDQS